MKFEKNQQLKRVLATKELELDAWKLKTQNDIRRQYEQCSEKLGTAHFDACEASCEESESIVCQREEFDLLAAERGRTAMLQEHRKREREAEQRLQQKKRKRQRDAMTQADLISTKVCPLAVDKFSMEQEEDEDVQYQNPDVQPEKFARQNQFKKSSDAESDCIVVEPSNDSSERESSDKFEFDQITNILKQNNAKTAFRIGLKEKNDATSENAAKQKTSDQEKNLKRQSAQNYKPDKNVINAWDEKTSKVDRNTEAEARKQGVSWNILG